MSAEHLSTGFYGKIPATGDFVSRRLPIEFVTRWDRWLAEHLAPLIGSELWPRPLALRFLTGSGSFGAATGIILQSADKVGRRFPLSIVAPLPEASIGLARANLWFLSIEELGIAAQSGDLTPDEFAAALIELPVPAPSVGEEIVEGMVVWTAHSDIFDIDPDAPQAVLERLITANWQTS
jgi:type VI secretion system protein ImpM